LGIDFNSFLKKQKKIFRLTVSIFKAKIDIRYSKISENKIPEKFGFWKND